VKDQNQTDFQMMGAPTTAEILGLVHPAKGHSSRLAGFHYEELSKRYFGRFAMHVLLVITMTSLFFNQLPLWASLGWAGAMTVFLLQAARFERALDGLDTRPLSNAEFQRHTANAAIKGVMWSLPFFAPLLAQGSVTDPVSMAAAWAIAALLFMSSSMTRFNSPLGAILFCAILGVGAASAFAIHASYIMSAITVTTGVFAIFATIEGAKSDFLSRQAQHGMHEKSEVVSLLLREYEDSGADWLFELDTNRRLRSVSPRLAYALGHEPAEVEKKSFLKLISGENWDSGDFPPSLRELANKIRNRENFSNLTVQVEIKGERRWWELSGTPIVEDDGQYAGFRGVGSDVTAQHESSEKIAYLARYDTLTSLPNRLMLHEALGDALKHSEKWRTRCAFLMIDLDRFKAVNDSLGHQIGDQLLAQVASRLQSLMGEGELCGRLGGDEFGVVLRDASDRTRVEEIANSVISRLSEPYKVNNHILYVGASVGSALGPRDGKTVEELMRNADLSLYRSKDIGGGEHCEYEPKLHAFAEERRQLEFALRHALAKEELLLNFQPVVDAHSEQIVSFEALVRWISPEHGFVSPVKFIPLAEDTRLIVPIGKWVLRKACQEAMAWPSQIKVNVNVSPEQLIEPDFVSTVVQALSDSGLPAHRLEIEVTESIFMRDANIAGAALERIMDLGCSVALDDFGTGYSSLGYLRQLRFSTIKVDRTFVQGASQNSSESLAIIRAVVAMAQSMDVTTTAEGVETADEAQLIRELGCDKIQGYHFGRPMPIEEVNELFADKHGMDVLRKA
jgi:diguanylate cyclase (GGDEF)-like protein/PAS domain S-box-containing protein